MKKRVFTASLFILLLAALFLAVYDFPTNIDRVYPAVVYRAGSPSSAERTTVKVQGTLYRPLFRDAVFRGKISAANYSFTENYELIDVPFNKKMNYAGPLTYTTVVNGTPDLKQFGFIKMAGNFDRIQIQVIYREENGEQASNLFLSAPAETYQDALTVTGNLPIKFN